MRLFVVYICSLLFVGCASVPVQVTGVDDPFESTVVVSTFGFHKLDPLMNVPPAGKVDHFFRGFLSKDTGLKTYQLYFRATDWDLQTWDSFVQLETGERVSKELENVGTETRCGQSGCGIIQSFIRNMSLQEVQRITVEPLQIRIKSSTNNLHRDLIIGSDEAIIFLNTMQTL